MYITTIKTHKITTKDTDILKILDQYVSELSEKSILAVTSKIVSVCEGRVVAVDSIDKDELIQQEAQYYLPRSENPYHVSLTITRDMLVATAGIDESNADGKYVLWPENPQASASMIRSYLREKFGLQHLGVVITDSRTAPLRWGVTAVAIAYSGFLPLKDYIGTPDLFDRPFHFEKLSIADSLATAASVVMGEGSEQTPLAVIADTSFVSFRKNDPSREELDALKISLDKDIYAPFLKSVHWKKGKRK